MWLSTHFLAPLFPRAIPAGVHPRHPTCNHTPGQARAPAALKLPDTAKITLAQTVGQPKK